MIQLEPSTRHLVTLKLCENSRNLAPAVVVLCLAAGFWADLMMFSSGHVAVLWCVFGVCVFLELRSETFLLGCDVLKTQPHNENVTYSCCQSIRGVFNDLRTSWTLAEFQIFICSRKHSNTWMNENLHKHSNTSWVTLLWSSKESALGQG